MQNWQIPKSNYINIRTDFKPPRVQSCRLPGVRKREPEVWSGIKDSWKPEPDPIGKILQPIVFHIGAVHIKHVLSHDKNTKSL